MPFVDLFRFKRIQRIICRKKFRKKFGGKKKGKIFRKNQLKKIPKTLKFGEKIPESRGKLPGFSNPKNLRTLFSE
jgi:hypothetical protein